MSETQLTTNGTLMKRNETHVEHLKLLIRKCVKVNISWNTLFTSSNFAKYIKICRKVLKIQTKKCVKPKFIQKL